MAKACLSASGRLRDRSLALVGALNVALNANRRRCVHDFLDVALAE